MRRRKLMGEINVVPYIDVMLVLLVIFMVTAPLIQTASIDLPTVGKASTPPQAPIEVLIKRDASLALRDLSDEFPREIKVTRKELIKKIRQSQEAKPGQAVLIAGDKNIRYQIVLQIMDELNRAKITKVGLLVNPFGEKPLR